MKIADAMKFLYYEENIKRRCILLCLTVDTLSPGKWRGCWSRTDLIFKKKRSHMWASVAIKNGILFLAYDSRARVESECRGSKSNTKRFQCQKKVDVEKIRQQLMWKLLKQTLLINPCKFPALAYSFCRRFSSDPNFFWCFCHFAPFRIVSPMLLFLGRLNSRVFEVADQYHYLRQRKLNHVCAHDPGGYVDAAQNYSDECGRNENTYIKKYCSFLECIEN